MELHSDEPSQGRNLNNLHQVRFGVDTDTLHTSFLKFLFVVIVEFIAMAVTFLNVLALIGFESLGILVEHTFVSSQTHCAAHVGDGLLFFHDIDNIVRSLFIHLAAVGISIAQYIAGKFDGDALHAQTDTECGNIVCTSVLDSYKLTFDTTLSEARADNDTVHVFDLLFHIFISQFLAVDEVDVGLAVVVCCCL